VTAVAVPSAEALETPDLAGYPAFLRPRVAAPGVYFAGFWVRLGVNLVDTAIQALLYLVVSYVLQLVAGIIAGIGHLDSDTVSRVTSILAAIAVFVYYSTIVVARNAATPGMRFCSMRIVRDSDITVAPDRRTLLIRGAIWIGFSVVPILRVIDALFIVFDPRKRSLHDRMVGTVVVRKAPSPPRIASMLCTVCGRPVDEGTLCPKHGGTMGLTITLSGHTVSLQIAASLLTVVAIVAFVVGVAMLLTSSPAGGLGVLASILLLRTTMSLTQLRRWARWAGSAVGVAIALGGVVAGVAQLAGSKSSGGFLLAGGAVGVLITACLWTPETYRSFHRIP
jgi:uncharacterized RDD family membrane protein YckC